jgi:hypothetical protein
LQARAGVGTHARLLDAGNDRAFKVGNQFLVVEAFSVETVT